MGKPEPLPDLQAGSESSTLVLSSEGISVHMRIPAERAYLHNAVLTLREICEHLELSAYTAFKVLLPLEEALLNTMEHAYPAASGLIDIQFALDGRELVVVVEDFGVGIPNGLWERDLDTMEVLRERGRGLAVVRGFPDRTLLQSANGRGMRTTMMFNLPLDEVT